MAAALTGPAGFCDSSLLENGRGGLPVSPVLLGKWQPSPVLECGVAPEGRQFPRERAPKGRLHDQQLATNTRLRGKESQWRIVPPGTAVAEIPTNTTEHSVYSQYGVLLRTPYFVCITFVRDCRDPLLLPPTKYYPALHTRSGGHAE